MTAAGQAGANGVLRFAFPFLIDKNAMKPYLHFDGIDHVEGGASPSIEDATQGGGRLLEEISEHLLGHVLVFHKLSDSVFCFHLVSF